MVLPPNLNAYRKDGKLFYRYRFPDGKRRGLGSDVEEACRLAQALNERLANLRDTRQLQRLDQRVTPNAPFARVAADFLKHWVESTERNYSPASLAMRRSRVREYIAHWHVTPIGQIDTFEIAQFLRKRTQEAARQHRVLLRQLFTYGVEEGLIATNPVNATNARRQPVAQRQRHTWERFSAILAAAEPWLARAIKLALYSVQRRGDLVLLHRDQVNLANRTIRIRQRKTGADLLIGMGDDLYQVVRECLNSPLHCPYLIHTRPRRLTAQIRAAKVHPFAVTEAQLTRAFSDLRDELGVYDHLPKLQRPGFHCIRALGIFALQRAGFPIEYIQALAGHADESMTQHYLAGHEKIAPLKVQAGLSLAKVDWSKVDWNE
jgi:enterobacteria phage integrase